jgi:hypothetical protein
MVPHADVHDGDEIAVHMVGQGLDAAHDVERVADLCPILT